MKDLIDRLAARDAVLLRRLWGTGIGAVMLIAVAPYPVAAFVVDDEIPHRIHNVVGSIQYLPLWAVPVLMLTWGRDAIAAWRLALVSSLAMFGIGIASGDLVASLSWMPLVTLLPLWRRHAWRPVSRPSVLSTVAAVVAVYVAVRHAPDLVELQRLDMGDSHSARFHFSGMAASYSATAGALAVLACYPTGRSLRLLVAGSTVVAGATSLAWPIYESGLPATDAWLLVIAGVLAGADALTSITRRGVARSMPLPSPST